MKQIVFLATHWGTKGGGVNSFNLDLCTTVAKIVPKDKYQVVCVVLKADEKTISQAKQEFDIELVSLKSDKQEFDLLYADSINEILRMRFFNQIAWWVGHDVITGEIALKLKETCNRCASNVAIIHHANYAAYKSFQLAEQDTQEFESKLKIFQKKIKTQQKIFRDADALFAVGPYLQKSAKDIGEQSATSLIPGLIENPVKQQAPSLFRVFILGRLESPNDVIKQLTLSLKAIGKAYEEYKERDDDAEEPIIEVYGISKDADEFKKLLTIPKESANVLIPVNAFPYEENRQNLWSQMKLNNLCLMPSLHEGFGLAGWEAIGLGVPLILSKKSGLFRLLKEQHATGYVQGIDIKGDEELDIKYLANCIEKVYFKKQKYKDDAIDLRQLLLKKGYTWKKTAQDFLTAIEIEHNRKIQSIKKAGQISPDNQTPCDLSSTDLKPYSFYYDDSQEEGEFQGRSEEYKWLKEQFNKVTEFSRSRTLLLKGERGIGKTRLINVFAEDIAKKSKAHIVIHNFNEKDPDQMFAQLAVDVYHQYSENLSFGERIVKLVNTILKGMTVNAVGDSQDIKTENILLNLFMELSHQHPLVIVLENLHFSEIGIKFFENAASNLKNGKFLVIGTVRSELEKYIDAPVRKQLKGLEWFEVRKLVNSFCYPSTSLGEAFHKTLAEKTNGNPLYIIEVIKYLKENKVLVTLGNKWIFTEDLEKLPRWTSELLGDIVMQQLEILGKCNNRAKNDIEKAAVIGPRFLRCLLRQVAKYNDDEIDEFENSLSAMRERGLVKPVEKDNEDILPGKDTTYYFQSQIIQEALYKRHYEPQLHLAIAEILAKLYENEHKESLRFWCAYHYLLSKNEEKAIPFLLNLLDDVQSKQLPFESIWLLKRTLNKFASDLDIFEEVQLRRNLAQRYSEIGCLNDAFESYGEACKRADNGKNEYKNKDQKKYNKLNSIVIEMATEQAWIRVKQGPEQFDQAEALFKIAFERLKKADSVPEDLPVKLYRLYGGLFLEQSAVSPIKKPGIIKQAFEYTNKAKELMEKCDLSKHDNKRHNVLVLNNIGRVLLEFGNYFLQKCRKDKSNWYYEKAQEYFKEALDMAGRGAAERLTLEAYIHHNLGIIAVKLENYDEAITKFNKSLKNIEMEDNVFLRTKSLQNLSKVYNIKNEFEEMEKRAEEGLWYAKLLDHREYQYDGYFLLGVATYKLGMEAKSKGDYEGRLESARILFKQAHKLLPNQPEPLDMLKEIDKQLNKIKEKNDGYF
ncbi:MAG: AAA family ATPase [Desulfobacterales bacterium]|nr:AAA family ATPase [Desulfobacterales bacterium]